jgi:hypothetical protein
MSAIKRAPAFVRAAVWAEVGLCVLLALLFLFATREDGLAAIGLIIPISAALVLGLVWAFIPLLSNVLSGRWLWTAIGTFSWAIALTTAGVLARLLVLIIANR